MENPQPRPIAWSERQVVVVCVIITSGVFLSLEESCADVGEEGIPVR
jgi:hypothetical protein